MDLSNDEYADVNMSLCDDDFWRRDDDFWDDSEDFPEVLAADCSNDEHVYENEDASKNDFEETDYEKHYEYYTSYAFYYEVDEYTEASELNLEFKQYVRMSVIISERRRHPDNKRSRPRRKGRLSLRSMQFAIAAQITQDKLEEELSRERWYGHELEDETNATDVDYFEDEELRDMLERCLEHERSSVYSPPYNAELDWILHLAGATA